MEPLDLQAETAYNISFYPQTFFKGSAINREVRCITKIHFDYNLRRDQVVNLLFRSYNLTRYWDVQYHFGPCFSEKHLN